MKSKKVIDLITGEIVHKSRLFKLVGPAEYEGLMKGKIVHKWEHTKRGLIEIKL